jgi:ERCC4-type nuclease
MGKKPTKPKIVVDSREPERILDLLKPLCKEKGIRLETAMLEVGDYEITDSDGHIWCVERKTMSDCYTSIITKTSDGKTGRIYDQISRLIFKYGERAMLLLENPFYVAKQIRAPMYKVRQTVFTFMSERSLVIPTLITRDGGHTAYLLVKLAANLDMMEFRGREIAIARV